ncbi:hypothetical protein D1007_48802 [Hordeum vulgare]|nr:hypothetical protein D1007_48802 [Hordeum vulgare]
MTTRSIVVRATSPSTCDTSPSRVPTLCKSTITSNAKGTNLPPPDEYHDCALNSIVPCDEETVTSKLRSALKDEVREHVESLVGWFAQAVPSEECGSLDAVVSEGHDEDGAYCT